MVGKTCGPTLPEPGGTTIFLVSIKTMVPSSRREPAKASSPTASLEIFFNLLD